MLVKRPTKGAVGIKTHPKVLKVVQLRESGVVVLEGRNGVQVHEQIKNVAPCSLAFKDMGVQPERYHTNDFDCWISSLI